eukprot:TRINITY_DN234_c0_g1_i20.p1 TRINITY_DN234_c0_g1~~TRINITY_DN234_c0_g1_i20.p1  ORF type:complete len:238 (+),score=52.81 TRINITY_DN234_c0_g1_i20:576-1289(+)
MMLDTNLLSLSLSLSLSVCLSLSLSLFTYLSTCTAITRSSSSNSSTAPRHGSLVTVISSERPLGPPAISIAPMASLTPLSRVFSSDNSILASEGSSQQGLGTTDNSLDNVSVHSDEVSSLDGDGDDLRIRRISVARNIIESSKNSGDLNDATDSVGKMVYNKETRQWEGNPEDELHLESDMDSEYPIVTGSSDNISDMGFENDVVQVTGVQAGGSDEEGIIKKKSPRDGTGVESCMF